MFDALEVREDGLLDEPVRGPFEPRSGVSQAGAQQIVDFNAQGGARHISVLAGIGTGDSLKSGRIVTRS